VEKYELKPQAKKAQTYQTVRKFHIQSHVQVLSSRKTLHLSQQNQQESNERRQEEIKKEQEYEGQVEDELEY
jgi:hypothetical protein